MLEGPVKKLSIPELSSQLGQSGNQLTERLATCGDTQVNRRQLSHLIGIERWGQRRLRVAIGEPYLDEEYDHYCPSLEKTWDELISEWKNTRQTSITMTKEISELNSKKILHNQFGPLSVKAWLRYLDVHASSEGRKIK